MAYKPQKTVYAGLEPPVLILVIAEGVEYISGGHIPKGVVYAAAAGAYGLFCALRNWLKNRGRT